MDARVVTLSSGAHRGGRIAFDNLEQAALLPLVGVRAVEARQPDVRARARPPAARCRITIKSSPRGLVRDQAPDDGPPKLDALLIAPVNKFFAQDADTGALPTLYAATEPGLEGGLYIGPDGVGEMRGHPTRVSPNKAARTRRWPACFGTSPRR